jgi:hypothetical protein
MKKYIIFICLLAFIVPQVSLAKTSDRITQIDSEIKELKLKIKTLEKERALLLGTKSEKKEAIILKEKYDGSADFSKDVTLAVFDITALKNDLNGKTFSASVKGVLYPSQEVVKYVCPELIKKGETKTCRIKVGNLSSSGIGRTGINYSITDVSIGVVGSSKIYKNVFPAVTGYIADK